MKSYIHCIAIQIICISRIISFSNRYALKSFHGFSFRINTLSNRQLSLNQVYLERAQHEHDVVRTLLIDNFDSYTFNIWQAIAKENNREPSVIYNNNYDFFKYLMRTEFSDFDNIIISPGPGTVLNSADFGICRDIILNSPIPILGVCLGHQGIAYAYGGKICKAPEPVHGRISSILHTENGLFKDIEQETKVVRYHSLITLNDVLNPLPTCLKVTAWTNDGIIMGLEHKEKSIYGKN